MANPHKLITGWDQWLKQASGVALLNAERAEIKQLFLKLYGKHVVLVGTAEQQKLLDLENFANFTFLPANKSASLAGIKIIETNFKSLALASGSIDLVILPHILEMLDYPRELLQEACRVVKPQGHIVICGFNPISFWGLTKLWARNRSPWNLNTLSPRDVQKWLSYADFNLVKRSYACYRPLVKNNKLYGKLNFLEYLGKKIFPALGSVYILVAQANLIPMTPIKMRWKQTFNTMHLPAVSIPSPRVRNLSK